MNDEITVDLRQLLKVLGKWKWFIAVVTSIAVITSGILSWFVLPPVYQAKSVIQVVQGEQKQVTAQDNRNLEDVVNSLSRLPQMTMNTYVSQIKNQVVFQRVIDRLTLDKNLYTPGGVAGMVTAQTIKDTNLIEIQVQNTTSELAANLANAIGEEFMLFINENNQQKLSKSVEYLKTQMESTNKELTVAVEKLRKFDAQPRSVDYLAKQMSSLLEDLSNYRSQSSATRIDLLQAGAGQSRLQERLTQTPKTIEITREIPAEPGNTEKNASDLQTVVAEQPNPAYDQISNELTAKEVTISEMQARVGALETTVVELENEIEGLQAEIAGKRSDRDRLQGDQDRLKATYSVLAEKITQTQITRSINIGDTSLMVVAKAVTPTNPIKPKKQLNMVIAFVLGLIASIFLAFFLEFMDNTLKTPEDIQRYLGLPLLGSIPLVPPLNKNGNGVSEEDRLLKPELSTVNTSPVHYRMPDVTTQKAFADKE